MNERQKIWDEVGCYADEIYSLWHNVSSQNAIRERIYQYSLGGREAADFGCGAGYWLSCLAEYDQITAFDFSETLLAEARKRSPQNTAFILGDINNIDVKEKFDFGIFLNALMPEGHKDALEKLSAVFSSLRVGGKLILVTFSAECASTFVNLGHFVRSKRNEEEASLDEVIEWYLKWQNNPLGYSRHKNGTVNKFWVKEEAEAVFSMAGYVDTVEYFKVPREWSGDFDFAPWFHGWVLEKVE